MTGVVAGVGAVVAVTASLWFYRTRELPVPGRTIFALLRGGTLVLLLLLLWNPTLPTGGRDLAPPVLLLDTSASMEARGPSGDTPAGSGAAAAEAFEGSVREAESGLADAAARAVEGGARAVTVVTDLRGGDGVALRALAAESAVPIRILDGGAEVANAGISGIAVPDQARPGEEVPIRVRVHATDRAPRTLMLTLGGDTVGRVEVEPGEPGTEATAEFVARVPETTASYLEVQATLQGGDALALDDRRVAALPLDDPAGGIVAVSWAPDWEYRSLVPLLDEVSGLNARAYLGLADGRWLRASEAPAVVDTEALRSVLSRAEMVVLHAAPVGDTGLVEVARRVPRRLELGIPEGRVGLSPPQPGEWYIAADLPASPIAAELAGLELLGLPPLVQARTAEGDAGSPIMLQRGGSGTPVPAFALRRAEGERVVEARAEGFWRWSLRSGDARELYRRLWSGLTAWLLTPDATTRTAGFGPRQTEVRPDAPIEVVLGEGESLELLWAAGPDTLRTDTLPAGAGPLTAVAGFDRRGTVSWTARVLTDSVGTAASASGALVIQPDGAEMRPARDTALPEEVAALGSERLRRAGSGTPLREAPWAWLAIVLLLSTEWIGRRRSGLR